MLIKYTPKDILNRKISTIPKQSIRATIKCTLCLSVCMECYILLWILPSVLPPREVGNATESNCYIQKSHSCTANGCVRRLTEICYCCPSFKLVSIKSTVDELLLRQFIILSLFITVISCIYGKTYLISFMQFIYHDAN